MEEVVRTLGEKRVRALHKTLNDSEQDYLDQIKQKSVDLIDTVNNSACNPDWDDETVREYSRLKALSLTALEEAAMWAVKMATI